MQVGHPACSCLRGPQEDPACLLSPREPAHSAPCDPSAGVHGPGVGCAPLLHPCCGGGASLARLYHLIYRCQGCGMSGVWGPGLSAQAGMGCEEVCCGPAVLCPNTLPSWGCALALPTTDGNGLKTNGSVQEQEGRARQGKERGTQRTQRQHEAPRSSTATQTGRCTANNHL